MKNHLSALDIGDWSISLVVVAPSPTRAEQIAQQADRLLDALSQRKVPDTVVSEGEGELALSFTISAATPDAAVGEGVRLWREIAGIAGVESWPLVRAEAATYDELDRDFRASALPAPVGVAEVRVPARLERDVVS